MTIPVDPSASAQPPPSQPSQQAQPLFAPQQSAQPATPQQPGQQKPAYTFDSIEAATAFAEAQLEKKRQANAEAAKTNEAYNALKQQVDFLVAQQRLAQTQAIAANVQLAAKTAGFRNPSLVYGAIASQLQYDAATGQPTNVQAVLDALKASDPYLLEQQSAPPAEPSQQQPAQPGQQQPLPSVPGVQTSQTIAQQPRAGLMNAPQSATTLGGALTWETIQANIRNPTWLAQNQARVEAFMADPLNHQQIRQR